MGRNGGGAGRAGIAVLADGVRKRYGETAALDGLDLAIPAGTVHGLLGPNGAGKTTAVRVFTTLLRPDGGRAEVAGCDVVRQATAARYRIGLVGQHAAVDEILSGRQNLIMFGRLHHLDRRTAARRADELLDRFALTEAGGKPVSRYSGGMRRRLDLAAGLILSPTVLFLDEPTTGLDPAGRNEVWSAVRTLADAGTTVVLTTQYLEEADQLADRISVLDAGRVIAEDTPDGLKSRIGGDRLDVVVDPTVGGRPGVDPTVAEPTVDVAAVATLIARVTGAPAEVADVSGRISVRVTDRVTALTEVVRALHERGVPVADIALRRPTLDEVFLQLTARPGATPAAPAAPAPAATATATPAPAPAPARSTTTLEETR